MHGTVAITNVTDVELTMTVTMQLSEWRDLGKCIGTAYPGWKFSSMIQKLVDKATFRVTETEEA